jgi:enoyl-CoA hydratase/carnithine racemase
MTDHVLTSTAGSIFRIVLNRPEKKNAITFAMYSAMAAALEEAERSPGVRVVAISGAGGSFTSGNDVADFLEHPPLEDGSQALRFLRAISTAGKPVIAGVNGPAIGIGATMLLHCDLAYAADSASFQLPFVNLGLVPEAASSMLLPRMTGYHRAAELLLLGERFDARAALEMGLVNSVHPAEQLMAVLEAKAAALAAQPPAALRVTKELLKRDAESVPARMAQEGRHFAQQLRSPEAQEAFAAFIERRKPDFSRFAG